VKMAAAVTPLVSIGRASIRPRYHPTNPAPAPAPTTPVLLLDGTKAGAAMREGAPDGGHRGCGGDGLEEMRWERMRNQGEEGPIPQRSGTWRRPPAVAMAAAAARGLQGSERVGGEGGDGAHASVARSPLKLEWKGRPVFKADSKAILSCQNISKWQRHEHFNTIVKMGLWGYAAQFLKLLGSPCRVMSTSTL
jgi:hypothetical protein